MGLSRTELARRFRSLVPEGTCSPRIRSLAPAACRLDLPCIDWSHRASECCRKTGRQFRCPLATGRLTR